MKFLVRILIAYWIPTVLGFGICAAAESYELGSGKNVGPINFAGYSNLEADFPRGSADELSLDLSLFISGHFTPYLNPFVEAEMDHWVLARQSGGAGSGRGTIERLFNDINLDRSVTVRLGKMLTPVGEWNLIHAPPLVWTVTRPLSTYYSFPDFITGASFNWRVTTDGFWSAQVYAQPGADAFDRSTDYEPRRYSRVAGLNIRYAWDLLSRYRLGASLQSAHLPQIGLNQVLGSLYGGFTTGSVRWSFQAVTTDIEDGTSAIINSHERGGYLQAVYPLNERWSVIVQGERFLARDFEVAATKRLIGIDYRPQPAISWKLDYLNATGAPIGASTGVYAAWAVLF